MTFRIAKAKKASVGRLIGAFMRDENGSTAIEYGLIATILAIALVSSLLTLKQTLTDDIYAPVVAGVSNAREGS